MEEELPDFVSHLKIQFDSCDSTDSGFLDKQEVMELCTRLQLQQHTRRIVHTLMHTHNYGRVTFAEFHQVLIDVLSGSLDFTSEDESSYLEPALPQVFVPQTVRRSKRSGRRSNPDVTSSCDTATSDDLSPSSDLRAKVRRPTSVDSVESLKGEEVQKEHQEEEQEDHQEEEHQEEEQEDHQEEEQEEHQEEEHQEEEQEEDQEEEHQEENRMTGGVQEEVTGNDVTAGSELKLHPQDALLEHLHRPISIQDFQAALTGSAPTSFSTPTSSADLQGVGPLGHLKLGAEPGLSLLTSTEGPSVLSRLDEGSGWTDPERVVLLWTDQGVRNGTHILQLLDFSLDERLSLSDLTGALDNELLVSTNTVHQAALLSYKDEVQHLRAQWEMSCRQRDKLKLDLDQLDQRNLQLVREVDERHVVMETMNQSRIRELEKDYRDRLSSLRRRAELESEALQLQADADRENLQEALMLIRKQEEELKDQSNSAALENQRLQQELNNVRLQLLDAQNTTEKLQRDLQQLLHHKFGSLDTVGATLSHEEKFIEIIKEYELQCRDLRDRNDELQSELMKSRHRLKSAVGHTTSTRLLHCRDSDSDDSDLKRNSIQSLEETHIDTAVSIQTELAMEQLKQNQQEELQQLRIQLESQMNFYERKLDLMRQSVEVEHKDVCQAFKLEISELEEQKCEMELQVKQLKETVEKLTSQLQRGGAGGGAGWNSEQERRLQRERSEVEQNFATEISNLVQQLRAEKEQKEAELQLKMDQEVQLVRNQLEEVRSENSALQERLHLLQQEVQTLEEDVEKRRRRLQEVEKEQQMTREEEEQLQLENARCRQEVLVLSSRNLQLSSDNATLSACLHGDQEAVRLLRERLATVSEEQEEGVATVRRLQEAALQHDQETLQLHAALTEERAELSHCREQLAQWCHLEAELNTVTLKLDQSEESRNKMLQDADLQSKKMEQLQHTVVAMETQVELLRSQLIVANQEKLNDEGRVCELQRTLRGAESQVQLLEMTVRRLKEVQQQQEVQKEVQQQQEVQQLRVQNQDLQNQTLSLMQQQQEERQRWQQEVREEVQQEVQHLQLQVEEEQRRSCQLEEALQRQTESNTSLTQGHYETTLHVLQQESEKLQVKLTATRSLLQQKVEQLKEELVKGSACSARLKESYQENSQLVAALGVTERRQKAAEKKNLQLEQQVGALHMLLRDVVTATLAT